MWHVGLLDVARAVVGCGTWGSWMWHEDLLAVARGVVVAMLFGGACGSLTQ
jgi:hypothetical protein